MAAFGNSKNDSDDAPLCANYCGFYGNPKNRNLCSVCYADFLKETMKDHGGQESSKDVDSSKFQSKDEEPNLEARQPPSAPSAPSVPESTPKTCKSVADLNTPTPKTTNRCNICKKKVGLLGFKCRCGGSFCGKHRYAEEHSCNVDYKAIGRNALAKQIVECKAPKSEFRI